MLLELFVTILAGLFVALCVALYRYPYLDRDLPEIALGVRVLGRIRDRVRKQQTIVDVFLSMRNNPKFTNKPFLLFQDEVLTYDDVDRLSNKFANYVLKASGLKCGDTIAMFMHNEPAFIWTWLGFAKLGIKCAFLNYNLRSKSLLHCITVSHAKAIVVGKAPELLGAVKDLLTELQANDIAVWVKGAPPTPNPENCLRWVDEPVENQSDVAIPRSQRKDVDMGDTCVYIYTSGTTGLPKPAKITYKRINTTLHILDLFNITSDDIVYSSLPLYHSSAFLICFISSLQRGATVALRTKFSASHFWTDCCHFNATVVMYIGEICRYLLATPQHPDETRHRVRMAVGNGLRPDIWTQFQNRFNIPVIGEFYGATEGNMFFRNCYGKVGAIGRVSPLIKLVRPFHLIKYEYETAEPIRDENGRCVKVGLGQPGLLIVRIDKIALFDGYAGKKEHTQKKVLTNVFKEGDQYFNSGDIITLSKDYYLYFNDRIGDTFRWKGENVATTEVSQVLGDFPAVFEANVYGVEVTGNSDGRAGMAAITLKEDATLDRKKLFAHVTSSLPNYACPRFLRLQKEMATTSTYKHTKTELTKEGFDPKCIKEPLYFMDMDSKEYVPLDEALYQQIIDRKVKL
ncbi:long-chain fatty acid transport protein 2-like [Ptychodera flava]|uniref:long-chain fatty acid transport protein 2-like n=1 Tax=Ptychodera flava TaxID=63121 RepID=UPI00396A8F08